MRNTPRRLTLLCLWFPLSVSASVADAQSVEREIVVSVVDADGIPVADLSPSDVIVTEDGIRREVLSVRRDTEPRQIALLVDTSQAAGPAVRDFKKAAAAFVDSVGDGHEVSIISFGGPPRILAEATDDRARLHAGVDKIFSYSNTAGYLLDAVSETVRGFQRRATRRPVIVVLTTLGVDYSNGDDLGTLKELKDAGVAMHALVLTQATAGRVGQGGVFDQATGRRFDQDIGRGPFQADPLELDRFLHQGPTQSGGRRRDLLTFTSVEVAMNDLTAQLRQQYVVTYARPGMLIPPERIQVAASQDGLDARGTPIRVESDQ